MNKKIFYSVALAAAALSMTGCADGELQDFFVSKTDSIANLEYLNQYDALKTYVNRQANPNFKLGVGEGAQNYIDQDITYRLANANFDEMTAGNAMKYASCVKEDGSMDFNLVKNFVSAASDAGMTVFGHTLAWHSQQQNKYLNGLIADKELPPSEATTRCLIITNPKADGHWSAQLYFPAQLKSGKKYVLKMGAKATADFQLILWGCPNDVGLGSLNIGTSWADYELEFTPSADFENFCFAIGNLAGEMDIKSIGLYEAGSSNNMIANGDISSKEVPCTKPYGWHAVSTAIGDVSNQATIEIPSTVAKLDFEDEKSLGGWGMDHSPKNVNGVCQVGNDAAKSADWNAQINFEPGFVFEKGQTYHLKMKIKGSVDGSFGACFQNPDGYKGCGDFQKVNVTQDWKEVDVATKCNGDGATRLLLNIGQYAGMLYIDDYEVYIMKSANSIPLTPEQKKDTLTWAMNKWIDGMMEACDGKVVAWDVVNEALSGADTDGDGIYDLQHAATASAEDKKNCFYWQDYLGDLDYVRTAVKAARESFAAHNGNAADLKLFINDYNLESTWDNNKKLESLIEWIKRWEADQVTKIDGIASQMHVSYNADPAKQEKQKECIVNMYKLMAKSGKLCKVSELDMGYVDAAGNVVETKNLNDTQQKEMADFYQFIIEEYFKNIPANQRYGITQWCITDAPDNSGWRKNQPVGLWTQGYDRKRAYGGFAEGLKTGSPLQ